MSCWPHHCNCRMSVTGCAPELGVYQLIQTSVMGDRRIAFAHALGAAAYISAARAPLRSIDRSLDSVSLHYLLCARWTCAGRFLLVSCGTSCAAIQPAAILLFLSRSLTRWGWIPTWHLSSSFLVFCVLSVTFCFRQPGLQTLHQPRRQREIQIHLFQRRHLGRFL